MRQSWLVGVAWLRLTSDIFICQRVGDLDTTGHKTSVQNIYRLPRSNKLYIFKKTPKRVITWLNSHAR